MSQNPEKKILARCLRQTRQAIDKALENNDFLEAKRQSQIRKACKLTLSELKPRKKKK